MSIKSGKEQIVGFDAKIDELGIALPPAPSAIGVYKPIVVVGTTAYLSGHGPLHTDGTFTVGQVGTDFGKEAGYDAARLAGLAMLATLRAELGSLDRVVRLMKVFGMVNCTPEFTAQPAVINGCSELFAELFGADCGIAARSAVGVTSLPGGWPVEIEAMFEVS